MAPSSDIDLGPAIIGSIAAIYTLDALVSIESLLAPLPLHETSASQAKERESCNSTNI